jgi:hypothetical protein
MIALENRLSRETATDLSRATPVPSLIPQKINDLVDHRQLEHKSTRQAGERNQPDLTN